MKRLFGRSDRLPFEVSMILLSYFSFGEQVSKVIDQLEVGGLAAVGEEERDHFQGLEIPLTLHFV